MPLPTSDQIKMARLKATQAKAQLQAIEAQLNEASRKLDTRRKIILGGLLIDAAVNSGLVEDTHEIHPQAEAASQLDGVHKNLVFGPSALPARKSTFVLWPL